MSVKTAPPYRRILAVLTCSVAVAATMATQSCGIVTRERPSAAAPPAPRPAPTARWSETAEGCPRLTDRPPVKFRAGKAEFERMATGMVLLDCSYSTGGGRSAEWVSFSLLIYLASTPEAARADAEASFARLTRKTAEQAANRIPDPVRGVGDRAVAFPDPGDGVELVALTDNATMKLVYASPRDRQRCLDDATVYARDALAHLR